MKDHYAGKVDVSTLWKVGDTRAMHINAIPSSGTNYSVSESQIEVTQNIVILDFKHDVLNDGSGKAAVTLQLQNCLSSYGRMNSSDTNSGGWDSSSRRYWCNEGFYNAIDLKSLVKRVNKITSVGNKSTSIYTSTDYCFLLSENEIFGTKNYAAALEGTQYEYYKTSANRTKKLGDAGRAYGWWERSPYGNTTSYFCHVNSDGDAYTNTASCTYGLAPGFCI